MAPPKDDDCVRGDSFFANKRQIQMTELSARNIVESINGEDPDRDGLDGTPLRFAKAFTFFTEGYTKSPEEVVDGAIFPVRHEEMVIMRDIPVYSLCEHHLIPFFGKAHIAYNPDPKIGVLGLSKLARLTDLFARRLQVQERLTRQIMEAIQDILKPRGVAVLLECRHMCMEMRGVQKASTTTVTKASCGVFNEDPVIFQEFVMLVLRQGDISEYCDSERLETKSNGCPSSTPVESDKPLVSRSHEVLEQSTNQVSDADKYILYTKCAEHEFETIAEFIVEAVSGPISEKNDGFSILDIGAGNGRILEALVRCSTKHQKVIAHYSAFEENEILCERLKTTAAALGFDSASSKIQGETFSPSTTTEEAGGPADVVLLSHSLYCSGQKEPLVQRALDFVAPGGILLIFHRWEPGGTLDRLSRDLTSQAILHQFKVFDVKINLADCTADGRRCLSKYTKGVVKEDKEHSSVFRAMGCIAIEPHSCRLGNDKVSSIPIGMTRKKVSYLARKAEPAAVVTPNTVVGITACLRAASLRTVGCGKVSVVGGGHSANCLANDAIAIDMHLWDHVVVDPSQSTVRVGGGATTGEITRQCEKHGLAVPLGDRPGVGMGLILQGGLNHIMRTHGLASDNIVRVVYISPTGELAVAEKEADLFPFRGAGTNFGVVLEVTLRAHKLEAVLVQHTEYLLTGIDGSQVLTPYSQAAASLPETASLDGFVFWSCHDTLSFATSYFDSEPSHSQRKFTDLLTIDAAARVLREKPSTHSPSGLFDSELYMTGSFDPSKALAPGTPSPGKLRSVKRCLLFPEFGSQVEATVFEAMCAVPTKWCYIHILHGGGAVRRIKPDKTAFGCRSWDFAVVITARWSDGDAECEKASTEWIARTVGTLLPHAVGVYASDLGPADNHLATLAFGHNGPRLASIKRKIDPLNILCCGCPLDSGAKAKVHNVPRGKGKGVVVIFCGRRYAGKDWLAGVAEQTLRTLTADKDGNEVCIERISDMTKRSYAVENDADESMLIHNRQYKESHRKDLSAFYEKKKAQDISYDARCFVEIIDRSTSSILLLTGMRDGLDYARYLAGRSVVLIKVDATEDSKRVRGWVHDAQVDQSPGECMTDTRDPSFWDLTYDNSSESTLRSAEAWVKRELAPAILKGCVRCLPDTPQPGIEYKDVVGNLLLQPFGLSLCSSLLIDWIRNDAAGEMTFDAVVAPEALGFVFASPVAARLKKPLVLVRKKGKLPGEVDKVPYGGSNMQNLREEDEGACSFELVSGSIQPDQAVIIIDDCLASGATVDALVRLITMQGGVVKALLCVMELPDLRGREMLGKLGVSVFSLMRFSGK